MKKTGPSRCTVGILGGMGPAATVDLMQRIIRATPAQDDVDHLRLLVDSNPQVPSRIAALIERTGDSPAPVLRSMAEGLVAHGADVLAMPCNTAHHYHEEVSAGLPVPFLNMVDLAGDALARADPALSRIGLLASSALQHIRLYEPVFEARGLEVVYPQTEQQRCLMDLITAIKAARATPQLRQAMTVAARDLEERGAQALLIACTELSAIGSDLNTVLPVFDAAEILSNAVVVYARGERRA